MGGYRCYLFRNRKEAEGISCLVVGEEAAEGVAVF
jgi:hypothetical protein